MRNAGIVQLAKSIHSEGPGDGKHLGGNQGDGCGKTCVDMRNSQLAHTPAHDGSFCQIREMIRDRLQRRSGEVKGKEESAQIAEWTAKEFCSIQKRNPKRGERFDVISAGRFLAFDLSQGRCWPIWRTD